MGGLGLFKLVSQVLVTVGIGNIVGGIVNVATPSNLGKFSKACTYLGGLVLACMVTDKATEYADEMIDDATEKIKELVEEKEQ